MTRKLAAAGATIQELNTVRRALSLLKGGGLAQCANPAKVTQLHNHKIGVHSQIPELGLCEDKRRKKLKRERKCSIKCISKTALLHKNTTHLHNKDIEHF